MKKAITTLLLFLTLLLNVNSAESYSPGYIITKTSEEIKVFIESPSNFTLTNICRYKKGLNDSVQTASTEQISGYYLYENERNFISKTINIQNTERRVFVEVLCKGVASLYTYAEKNENNTIVTCFYIEKANGEYITLTRKNDHTVQLSNGDAFNCKDEKYKGGLHFIFRDYESVGKKAHLTEFTRKDLTQITKEYNEFVHTNFNNPCELDLSEKSILKLNYGIYTGVSCSSYSIYKHIVPISYDLTHILGGKLGLSSPRFSKSLSLQADFSAGSRPIEDSYYSENQSSKPHHWDYWFSAELGVSYTCQNTKIHPSLEVGLDYKYLSSYNYLSNFQHPGFYTSVGINPMIGDLHNLFVSLAYEERKFLVTNHLNNIEDKALTLKLGLLF